MFEYYCGMFKETRREPFKEPRRQPPRSTDGPLQAMSPGVVDYLSGSLWREAGRGRAVGCEGIPLSAQPPGAELARRLSETDLEALTPTELFHHVRAAQRLAAWAESLREAAVGRYCAGKDPA